MYVWKNHSRRDRRLPARQLDRSRKSCAVPNRAVRRMAFEKAVCVRTSDAMRAHQALAERSLEEEREVRVKTKHVKSTMEAYLKTAHGRLELLAVGDELRREQELVTKEEVSGMKAPQDKVVKTDALDETEVADVPKRDEAQELARVRECFDLFDADGSGFVDTAELGALLRELCIPIRDADEMAEVMQELDADASGAIDFAEFWQWVKQNAADRQGGVRGVALAAAKVARALAGTTRMLEARRIIVACAVHDAERHSKLVWRQSRPLEDTDFDRTVAVDRDAERRFSCVRAVVGRPGEPSNDRFDVRARSFRAHRLLFHPDLWPLPPPKPEILPPAWMNAPAPRIADPRKLALEAANNGAVVQGFDPTSGSRAAPRCIKGLDMIGASAFLHNGATSRFDQQNSLAAALISLRRDVFVPSPSESHTSAVKAVPAGKLRADVMFSWLPSMLPRPKCEVSIEADFTSWRPVKLSGSHTHPGAYDVYFTLAPGTYRYRYRVDGRIAIDPTSPSSTSTNLRPGGTLNVMYVLAHHSHLSNNDPAFESLAIDLTGASIRDDGAWAIAAAVRAGGGGGALSSLSLRANAISADGAWALGSALASGAAFALQTLDLSHNALGAEGGHALGSMLAARRDSKHRPAPLKRVVVAGCSLGDEGVARLAFGIIGHNSLESLDLAENKVGELGATALSRALLRNGRLASLSLAANRLNVGAARAFAKPVRISGSLKSLELTDNIAIGPEGAAAIGEALAGGSHELVAHLEKERDAGDKNHQIAFFEDDDAEIDDDSAAEIVKSTALQESRRLRDLRQELYAPLAAKAARNRAIVPMGQHTTRAGTLEYLGLSRCGVGQAGNRSGVFALARGVARAGPLTSLDLRQNELDEWCALEFARVLSSRRCKLVELHLQGNPLVRQEWLWRDHAVLDHARRQSQGNHNGRRVHEHDDDHKLPSIATSLEANRRWNERSMREAQTAAWHAQSSATNENSSESFSSLRGERAAATNGRRDDSNGCPCAQLIVEPAHGEDPVTRKLEGEWTAAVGWYPANDKRSAKQARAECIARAIELARTRAERDAVEAAGAAAAASAASAARQPPDGPRLVTAVAKEIAAALDAQLQVAKSHTRRQPRAIVPVNSTPRIKTEAERARVATFFKLFDVDDSGSIDAEELRPLLARMGWPDVSAQEADDILSKVDQDGSGAVDFDELIKWWLEGNGRKAALKRTGLRRWIQVPRRKMFPALSDLNLRRDALRALEANARYDARRAARAAFRKLHAPRPECVCVVCGHTAPDKNAADRHHRRQALKGHLPWKRAESAALKRRVLIDRAKERVAEGARAKEASAVFDVSDSTKRASRFPVLLVYDGRVPHQVELQTYDVPDSVLGRPTGSINLRTGALYCVGDAHGDCFVATGNSSAEWLRVIWPSHAAGGGDSHAALASANIVRRFVDGGVSQGVDDDHCLITAKRADVWLHNRSRDFTKGRKPVLRPLKCGPTPYADNAANDNKATATDDTPPAKRAWWRPIAPSKKRKLDTLARKEAQHHAKEHRDAERRKRLLGDEAAYMCSLRSLNAGTKIVLWSRAKWYRTVPSLPPTVRLKVRAIPEVYGAVLGDVAWGQAVLIFGKAGHWLLGAFHKYDNAWFLERSPHRPFLQPVISTIELAVLEERQESPCVVEAGASQVSEGRAVEFRNTAPVAIQAESANHDDQTLVAVGGPHGRSLVERVPEGPSLIKGK